MGNSPLVIQSTSNSWISFCPLDTYTIVPLRKSDESLMLMPFLSMCSGWMSIVLSPYIVAFQCNPFPCQMPGSSPWYHRIEALHLAFIDVMCICMCFLVWYITNFLGSLHWLKEGNWRSKVVDWFRNWVTAIGLIVLWAACSIPVHNFCIEKHVLHLNMTWDNQWVCIV